MLCRSKLTADQRYLCKSMGTKLPFLPVHGEAECKLFSQLLLVLSSPLNYDQMALKWCEFVDGVTIFPKLPVYLRTYHSTWQRNQRIKDALAKASTGIARLKALNAAMMPTATDTAPAAASPATAVADVPHTAAPPPAAAPAVATQQHEWRPFAQHEGCIAFPPTMPQPPIGMALEVDTVVVGGTAVGGAPPTTERHRNGERGPDKVPNARNAKACKRCLMHSATLGQAQACPGRAPRGRCKEGYTCVICGSTERCKCSYKTGRKRARHTANNDDDDE